MKTTVAAQRNIFRELVRRFADQHEDNTDFREILVDARIALAQFTDMGEDVAQLEHYDTKPYADQIVREVRDYRCSRCHHHATDHDSFCRECGARFVRLGRNQMTKKEMMEIEKREIREDEAFVSSTSEYLHQLASRRLPWFDFKLEFAPVRPDTDGSRPCAIVLAFAGTSDNCDRIVHAWANAVHEVMGMHLNDNDRRTK